MLVYSDKLKNAKKKLKLPYLLFLKISYIFRNDYLKNYSIPVNCKKINYSFVILNLFCRFSIRAGEWRTDSSLDCGEEFCALPLQDIALSHVIVHPGYEQQTFKDDVALLVLRADINYTGKN